MNGQNLAKYLLSRDPHLKRLFMSGYAANVIAQRGLIEEDVYFIQKPFSFQKFAAHAYEIPGN
jgi:FixJ family two-component response regulator